MYWWPISSSVIVKLIFDCVIVNSMYVGVCVRACVWGCNTFLQLSPPNYISVWTCVNAITRLSRQSLLFWTQEDLSVVACLYLNLARKNFHVLVLTLRVQPICGVFIPSSWVYHNITSREEQARARFQCDNKINKSFAHSISQVEDRFFWNTDNWPGNHNVKMTV